MVDRLKYTPEEVETQRLESLADYCDEDQALEDLIANAAPGSTCCHEALDRTSVVMNLLDREVMQHPSVLSNPEWFRIAHEAHGALFHLYQSIGDEHLTPVEPTKADTPAKAEVHSHPNCVFVYCPDPEACKAVNTCLNLQGK